MSIHFAITGNKPDLIQRLFSNVVQAMPRIQPYIGAPVLQIPLGTDEHPDEKSPLIWGDQMAFKEMVRRRRETHQAAWNRWPSLAYIDAECRPKGKMLQMSEPWPAATCLLVAVRYIVAYSVVDPSDDMLLWSPMKHLGNGVITEAQHDVFAIVDSLIGSPGNVIVNCYPRRVGADHDTICANLAHSWSRYLRNTFGAVKLGLGDEDGDGVCDQLPATDAYNLVLAAQRHLGRVLVWMQADNDAAVEMWSDLVRPIGAGVEQAMLDAHAAPPKEERK